MFEETLKAFGRLDILINNAGIGEQKIIDETDDDWMLYVMNTNLGGPMRYIREALKIFLPQNDGVIINISSVTVLDLSAEQPIPQLKELSIH